MQFSVVTTGAFKPSRSEIMLQ